jgi:hypothetical protein
MKTFLVVVFVVTSGVCTLFSGNPLAGVFAGLLITALVATVIN